MASQRDIRRRIGAVKNIKQITRAMQFVAASKLKRAQDATLASRAYSDKLEEIIADLAAVLGGEEHPLLARREGGKRLIILITSDRGLSGPLNTNVIRFAAREITEHEGDLTVVTVGRKGRDAMRRARVPLEAHFNGSGDRPAFTDVLREAEKLVKEFVRNGQAKRKDREVLVEQLLARGRAVTDGITAAIQREIAKQVTAGKLQKRYEERLKQILVVAQEVRGFVRADAEHPDWAPLWNPVYLQQPNPDTIYLYAPLRGDLTYRVTLTP